MQLVIPQLSHLPLQGLFTLDTVNTSSQFSIISNLAQNTFLVRLLLQQITRILLFVSSVEDKTRDKALQFPCETVHLGSLQKCCELYLGVVGDNWLVFY